MYDFVVYVEKGTVKNVCALSISGDIVLSLVDGLSKGQNDKVFMDNWFTSLASCVPSKKLEFWHWEV